MDVIKHAEWGWCQISFFDALYGELFLSQHVVSRCCLLIHWEFLPRRQYQRAGSLWWQQRSSGVPLQWAHQRWCWTGGIYQPAVSSRPLLLSLPQESHRWLPCLCVKHRIVSVAAVQNQFWKDPVRGKSVPKFQISIYASHVWPSVGGKMPHRMFMRVDFPAPLWPSRAVIWPS